MNEEKLRIASNINLVFNQYQELYKRANKKYSAKKEIQKEMKANLSYKQNFNSFNELATSIVQENPSNAISLIKLWKHNSKINYTIFKKVMNNKSEDLLQINLKVKELMNEWGSLINLVTTRNKDILSLIKYIGEANENLEQVL